MTEAEEVLEEMYHKGLTPHERTYTCLIHSFCQESRASKAVKVFREMIDRGFSPSLDTYNAVIQTNAFAGTGIEVALEILREMPERGLTADAVSYCHVICALLLPPEEKLGKAFEMKKDMDDKGILPDSVTYEVLIDNLCWVGRLSEAFDLFREMLHRGGFSPDEHTYFNLMNCYCLQGEFSKAFHLHHEMVHKGFLPDFVTGFSPSLVTYNALIYGYCSLGRVQEALEIFRGMPEMGLSPDTVSYRQVISGLCKIREPVKAYELKLEMDKKRSCLSLNEDTYETLMEQLSDEDTYSSLINDYLAQGDLEKAYQLDYVMGHDGYLSDNVTLSVLLNGLNKIARTTEAKWYLLWTVFFRCFGMPAYIIYDTLIENCSNNEFKRLVGPAITFSVKVAIKAHHTMLHGNYKPDGTVYNLLIFDHSRSLEVHKAYNMYMEMVHYGFVPHMFSVLALIKALHYDGRYNEMSWVIHNTLRSCNLSDSELLKVLNEIDFSKPEMTALLDVLSEIAMDGLLLDGGKCSFASTST
ncbi:pentatricopeptide repeat-containing protein At5g39710-like [Lotus japonicus]|uniref:pentatricopeptide repeat-containing protein At5g39710-like n=1 Tax=Lotus japonicus TaxID=34305 RepID=UPI0025850C52|nr:pentatricopeptide repeat-containing protein At5g39710-like [Lotus japonicus]XP_057424698.1 pentatricopeptide repeat-containing protein At5g39710-like [Lotus japonicus]